MTTLTIILWILWGISGALALILITYSGKIIDNQFDDTSRNLIDAFERDDYDIIKNFDTELDMTKSKFYAKTSKICMISMWVFLVLANISMYLL